MGMFDQLNKFFSVGNTISQSSNTQPDDVLKTKSALAQTGDYKVPDFGITDIPDMGMIDGLKKFQQKNGLKVDGVMKPGGPTEAKIGETMANQGVTNTDLLAVAKPKPKVSKIDPLTGLPEVKMPKLKKPTAKMWEQVAQQQKPKTNPWFQSSKIKPVENEAHSANTRTMDGLLQYSKNGSLPALYADSLKNGDEKAVHEYANFMQQLSDRKGDRVDEFHQEVVSRLPENMKKVFAQLEMDVGGNETSMRANTEPHLTKRVDALLNQETANTKSEVNSDYCKGLARTIKEEEGFVKKHGQEYLTADYEVRKMEDKLDAFVDEMNNKLSDYLVSMAIDLAGIPFGGLAMILASAAKAGVDTAELLNNHTRLNEMRTRDLPRAIRKRDRKKYLLEKAEKSLQGYRRDQRQKCK